LKELNLNNIAINNAVLIALEESMKQNSSLENLLLGIPETPERTDRVSGVETEHYLITNHGWRAISRIWSCPSCGLQNIYLNYPNINDLIFTKLANGLARNTKVQLLTLGLCHISNSATQKGWHTLSSLLCHKSSIGATRYSNDTLNELHLSYVLTTDLEVAALLAVNRNVNKAKIALKKVIENHFSKVFIIAHWEESQVQLQLLPFTLSWLGRDLSGHTVLYEMIKNRAEVLVRGDSAYYQPTTQFEWPEFFVVQKWLLSM
jgi:hypothetical protein